MGRTDLPARLERSALDEKDVEVTVRVVVEERGAGAHLLGHVVLAGRAAGMRKRQSRLGGRFDEEGRGRRWRLRGREHGPRDQHANAGNGRGVSRITPAVNAID